MMTRPTLWPWSACSLLKLGLDGSPWGIYWALGIVETRRGRMNQARQSLQKAVDLCIEVDDREGLYISFSWRAWHYRQAGQTGQALRCCQEMYTLLEWLPFFADGFFKSLGMVLVRHRSNNISEEDGQANQEGLRLLALWNKIKTFGYLMDQEEYEQALEQLRDQMGEAAFQAVWAQGQAMTQEQGVAYAGSLLEKYASKV